MIPYAIHYNREATVAIYQIARGIAGEITLAIRALAREPRPFKSFVIEEPPNTFVMKVSGYFITYAIDEDTHSIIIALIEQSYSEE